jgi:hypothetical protein
MSDETSYGGAAAAAPGSTVATWLSAIKRAQRDQDVWNKRCEKIRKRYLAEGSQTTQKRKFAMLWSNMEVLKPSTYAKPPKPVCEDRWKSGDVLTRLASMALERTLTFQAEALNYDRCLKSVRDDYLLYGRGVPRVRYYPVLEEAAIETGVEDSPQQIEAAKRSPAGPGEQVAAYGDTAQSHGQGGGEQEEGYGLGDGDPGRAEAAPTETLKMEHLCWDFVQRQDLIHPICRTWTELPWLSYRAFLTRGELIKRFGKKVGSKVQLTAKAGKTSDREDRTESAEDKATVYEIWNKVEGKVLWISDGYPEPLEEGAPYLKLDGFFPSPEPAYGTVATDSLIPTPEFIYYQDQAQEIDDLTARIASLTDSLKLVGFYPAGPQGEGAPEIERAVKPGFENKMVAVKSWAAFTEGGKNGVPIVFLPIEVVIEIIRGCIELRKQLVEDVYQITGISDIMRGQSEASETATAQGYKAQFGSIRMHERQGEMARVARDLVRMGSEVICSTFDISTILRCANLQLPSRADIAAEQAQAQAAQAQWQIAAHQATLEGAQPPPAPPPAQLQGPTVEDLAEFLKDQVAVRMRVDIEVDSTIQADEQAEKAARTEFITATSQFITAWGPIVQASPEAGPLAGQLLLFGARGFRTARELQGTIEQFVERMEQSLAQPKQPQVDPTEQAKLELVKQQGQNAQEAHGQKMQADAQKHQQDMALLRQKGALEIASKKLDIAAKDQSHRHEVEKAQLGITAQKDANAFAHEQHGRTIQAADADQQRKHADAREQSQLRHHDAHEVTRLRHQEAEQNSRLKLQEAEQTARLKAQAADGDSIRKNADARETSALKQADAKHTSDLKQKDAEHTASLKQRASDAEVADTALPQLEELRKLIEEALAEKAKPAKPRKITITGRDAKSGRVSHAEVD